MSAPAEIDLTSYLAPISDESPTGVDPRADESPNSDFRRLRDARDEARRLERDAINNDTSLAESLPQWATVADIAESLLTSRAKDLEVACYLLEAWVRSEGFAGLRKGLALLTELTQQYWSEIFPAPTADGSAADRTVAIDRLRVLLPPALSRIPITDASIAGGPFTTSQIRLANDLEKLEPSAREERVRRGGATLELVRQVALETSIDFFQELHTAVAGSLEELARLDQLLTECCGDMDSPSLGPIVESLEQVQVELEKIAGDRLHAAEATPAQDAETAQTAGASQSSAAGQIAGPLRSRDEAFKMLEQVARFFEQMDPQSLLAAHIRRIVRLGKMSPAEYYTEILEDEATRARLFKLVGIEPPKSEE